MISWSATPSYVVRRVLGDVLTFGWKPNMDLAAVGVSWRLLLLGAVVAGKPGKTALHVLPEVKAA